MEKRKVCKVCGAGSYAHGSAMYDYYDCGHAFQKPLDYSNPKDTGKWVGYPSPHFPKKK
jgi:hypothetical protein